MNRDEQELLELGLLHPVVIPEVTRQPDGLQVGCRKHCPLPPSTVLADVIRDMVLHTEGLP
jgi:hypothetical protein